MRIALGVARAVGLLLLATAIAMIVGRVAGDLFGVKDPADPRTPGGPTPQDLEAFVAVATVLIGLIASGWRLVPGALVCIGGAIAFWAAIPELGQMTLLLGAFGAANLTGWLVARINERHHHHDEQIGPPAKRGHARPMTHHPVGLF
jgi:hypothetical protein